MAVITFKSFHNRIPAASRFERGISAADDCLIKEFAKYKQLSSLALLLLQFQAFQIAY